MIPKKRLNFGLLLRTNEAWSLFKEFVWKGGTQKFAGRFFLCSYWHGQTLLTLWPFQNTV
jgi:uncharacterized membrane protein